MFEGYELNCCDVITYLVHEGQMTIFVTNAEGYSVCPFDSCSGLIFSNWPSSAAHVLQAHKPH